jgi:hypothetical protein
MDIEQLRLMPMFHVLDLVKQQNISERSGY